MLVAVHARRTVRHREGLGHPVEADIATMPRKTALLRAEPLIIHAECRIPVGGRHPSRFNRLRHLHRIIADLSKSIDKKRVVGVGGTRIRPEIGALVLSAPIVEHKFLSAFPHRERKLVLMFVRHSKRTHVERKVGGIGRPAAAHHGKARIRQKTRWRLSRRRPAFKPLAQCPSEILAVGEYGKRIAHHGGYRNGKAVIEPWLHKSGRHHRKRTFCAAAEKVPEHRRQFSIPPVGRRKAKDAGDRRVEYIVVIRRKFVMQTVWQKLCAGSGGETAQRFRAHCRRIRKFRELHCEHIGARHLHKQPIALRSVSKEMFRLCVGTADERKQKFIGESRRLAERLERDTPGTKKAKSLLNRAPWRSDRIEALFRRDAARLHQPVRELPHECARIFLVSRLAVRLGKRNPE